MWHKGCPNSAQVDQNNPLFVCVVGLRRSGIDRSWHNYYHIPMGSRGGKQLEKKEARAACGIPEILACATRAVRWHYMCQVLPLSSTKYSLFCFFGVLHYNARCLYCARYPCASYDIPVYTKQPPLFFLRTKRDRSVHSPTAALNFPSMIMRTQQARARGRQE